MRFLGRARRGAPPHQLGVWMGAVSSPGGVRGETPENLVQLETSKFTTVMAYVQVTPEKLKH